MNINSSANLPPVLTAGKLPVVAAPLFIISVPDLVCLLYTSDAADE